MKFSGDKTEKRFSLLPPSPQKYPGRDNTQAHAHTHAHKNRQPSRISNYYYFFQKIKSKPEVNCCFLRELRTNKVKFCIFIGGGSGAGLKTIQSF